MSGGRLRALAALVWTLSCAPRAATVAGVPGRVPPPAAAAQASPASAPSACRFGTDYGSGMVAAGFPPALHEALVALHAELVARHPELLSDFLADQPYAPHVSLVYGVTEAVRPCIASCLVPPSPAAGAASAAAVSLGDLHVWDDPRGGKSTLVVAIDDPSGTLAAAHDRLQACLDTPARFSYTPHATLAYLRLGARLPEAAGRELQARLRQLTGVMRVTWVTDRCGLPTGYEALPPPAPH